ncbi:unnamed protein product [Bursaphelenchus xylophilus]|uniref:(pine wood nematode) hypothetical protein n=1 Tax=Bursaphelenchus xylophilus TaxID=6326 RepID=A0A1I7SFH6_BURXY|nr:unnamed protein product [Bursaphelenchus xylophilus]CAG9079029.1 unnamed protein product [Bursaphelenchus xylophilus]
MTKLIVLVVLSVLLCGYEGVLHGIEYMTVPHFIELLQHAEYLDRPLGLPETEHSQVNPAIRVDPNSRQVLTELHTLH